MSAPAAVTRTMPPTSDPAPPVSPVGGALVRVIGLYQGLRGTRPSPCRFWPTCSSYAVEAIERHGAGRGSFLALRRVLRCHPWGGRGVDLVPE